LIAAPFAFIVLLLGKMVTKIAGVYPVTNLFGSAQKEAMYTTLLMSTGLTFGTISALFGLSHGIIQQSQYSIIVAGVVASAVIPIFIANAFFLPRHLLPQHDVEGSEHAEAQERPRVVRKA
jgi:glutathione-regulated potassium-efflux system ancillary protein KefC